METLRQEVLESQKIRSDLLKWKLILVASLGAVGLGFTKEKSGLMNSQLILCIIPFVCVYVDLLCRHLSLRIHVIGAFLRKHYASSKDSLIGSYEKFVAEVPYAFSFESLALYMSSIINTVLVVIIGILIGQKRLPTRPAWSWKIWVFIISGVVGLILIISVEQSYRRKKKEIDEKAGNKL